MTNSLLVIIIGILLLYLVYTGTATKVIDVVMNPEKYEGVK